MGEGCYRRFRAGLLRGWWWCVGGGLCRQAAVLGSQKGRRVKHEIEHAGIGIGCGGKVYSPGSGGVTPGGGRFDASPCHCPVPPYGIDALQRPSLIPLPMRPCARTGPQGLSDDPRSGRVAADDMDQQAG